METESDEKKSEANRGWTWGFRKEGISITFMSKLKEQVEAAANYAEELAKIVHEGGYTKQQDFQCRWKCVILEEDTI